MKEKSNVKDIIARICVKRKVYKEMVCMFRSTGISISCRKNFFLAILEKSFSGFQVRAHVLIFIRKFFSGLIPTTLGEFEASSFQFHIVQLRTV